MNYNKVTHWPIQLGRCLFDSNHTVLFTEGKREEGHPYVYGRTCRWWHCVIVGSMEFWTWIDLISIILLPLTIRMTLANLLNFLDFQLHSAKVMMWVATTIINTSNSKFKISISMTKLIVTSVSYSPFWLTSLASQKQSLLPILAVSFSI